PNGRPRGDVGRRGPSHSPYPTGRRYRDGRHWQRLRRRHPATGTIIGRARISASGSGVAGSGSERTGGKPGVRPKRSAGLVWTVAPGCKAFGFLETASTMTQHPVDLEPADVHAALSQFNTWLQSLSADATCLASAAEDEVTPAPAQAVSKAVCLHVLRVTEH